MNEETGEDVLGRKCVPRAGAEVGDAGDAETANNLSGWGLRGGGQG